MAAEKLISVGSLRGPHGLKGMVKAKIGLDDLDLLIEAGPLLTKDGRALQVLAVQGAGQGMVALTIEGVTTVAAAIGLKGQEVFLDRSQWPEDEDQIYLDSLIGTDVQGPDGAVLGTVKGFVELPAGPALDVEIGDKVKVLPIEDAFVTLKDGVVVTELGVAILNI